MSTDLRARLRTLQEAQARQERELDKATRAGDLGQSKKVLNEGRQELHQHQEAIERMVLGEPEPASPSWLEDRELLARAAGAASDDEAREILRTALPGGIELKALEEWEGSQSPARVLWQTLPASVEQWPSEALAVGEVTLLSAPGGTGKSYLTLALAKAAAVAANDENRTEGYACGLTIRAGSTVLVSYEDSAVRLYHRISALRVDDGPGKKPRKGGDWTGRIHLWEEAEPLWIADPDLRGESGPSPSWAPLWQRVRTLRPALVVIDPASVALANLSASEGVPVRAFLRALAHEAEAAGTGILLVAHDTKAARNATRWGGDPGAGAVAGSASWFDAARNVLYLRRISEGERLLESLKSNHGRPGWGVVLAEASELKPDSRDLESPPLERYLGLEAKEYLTSEEEVSNFKRQLQAEANAAEKTDQKRRKQREGNSLDFLED